MAEAQEETVAALRSRDLVRRFTGTFDRRN
jgi:hypothetical protein